MLPLLGVDLRGRTLDSVEALLLFGVKTSIRHTIMSQIDRSASVIPEHVWSPSLEVLSRFTGAAFAACCQGRHS